MLAEHPLPANLDTRMKQFAQFCAGDPDIAALYLFGSRARGSAGARSDVDFAVVLRASFDPLQRWRKRLELLASATEMLGTDAVDVLVMEDVPAVPAHRVLRDGRLLCEPDPRRRTAVAEDVMRRYLDEEYLRKELDRGLAARLREDRFAR